MSDTGPRRRVTDQRPIARFVESSGFKLTTGLSLIGIGVTIIPAIIYFGRLDATIESMQQQWPTLINQLNQQSIELATMKTELNHVARLQSEVRSKLSNPDSFRPDPWTGTDDKRAMDLFEQRLRRSIEGIE